MKRIILSLSLIVLVLSIGACGGATSVENDNITSEASLTPTEAPAPPTEAPAPPTEAPAPPTKVPVTPTEVPVAPTEVPAASTEEKHMFTVNTEGITTTDELETRIEEHLESFIGSLNSRWEVLAGEIDTFEKYCEDVEKVSDFYEVVIDETNQMCIMLYEYSAVYARLVLDADLSDRDKYKAIDGINDFIYDDACDEIKDGIYDGILDEMKDYFYEGIIDDASDEGVYREWYEISSNEYSQWYDASSEVYSLYYDAASDIYAFYYDMSAELYSGDVDRAEKMYERFLKKIDKAKGLDTSDNISPDAKFDTTVKDIEEIEAVETTVEAHVTECIQLLDLEWTTLSAEINTYEKYLENIDKIEDFHTRVEGATNQILVMICEYGISYAELIMQSDLSNKEKYKLFEDVKECIYEDACDQVKDEIYDGLLNDIKDYYYEGILDDAKDNVKYSEWSDLRSDAYGWWSDARSEVYEDWSNIRGDIYGFWSDIRGELYGGDSDGAIEEMKDFKEKVDKMK